MTNRRVDAIYFVALLMVCLAAYYASSKDESAPSATRTAARWTGDLERPNLSDLELPSVTLPEPSFVIRSTMTERNRATPRPWLSDELESALVDVRWSLLASASPTEASSPD